MTGFVIVAIVGMAKADGDGGGDGENGGSGGGTSIVGLCCT
jgi:hypothetical protein